MHGTSTRLLRYMCLYFKGVALLTPSEVLGMINTLNSQNTYFCLLDSVTTAIGTPKYQLVQTRCVVGCC